jgi:hypothetical protein
VCFKTLAGVQELISQAPLTKTQKHLLRVYLHHARDKHQCWPGGLRLMSSTGIQSRQTLNTHQKALHKLGILSWLRPGERGNPHRSNLYLLHWKALLDLVARHYQAPEAPHAPPEAPTPPAVSEASTSCEAPPAVEPWQATEQQAPASQNDSAPILPSDAVVFNDLDVELVLDDALLQPSWPAFEAPQPALDADALPDPTPPEQEPVAAEQEPVTAETQVPDRISEKVQPAAPPVVELASTPPARPLPSPTRPHLVATGASSSDRPSSASAPPSPFLVPLTLVWNLWSQAYLQAYQATYHPSRKDQDAVEALARACSVAVLHHEQRTGQPQALRPDLAHAYLHHVMTAFLKHQGRNGFLQERRHPFHHLLEDLNRLGDPWALERKKKAGEAPEVARKEAPVLPREETLAKCREVLRLLGGRRPETGGRRL